MNNAAAPATPKKRGPKPKPPEERLVQCSVRFTKSNWAAVQEMALIYGISLSDVVNRCVEDTWPRIEPEAKQAVAALQRFRKPKKIGNLY